MLRDYRFAEDPEQNDVIIEGLPPGSLVVNATGLGKDRPGSPLTDNVEFPQNGYAWDFNYRGDLGFLKQAKQQKESKNLTVIDGWDYFIYGWTKGIADIFHIDIPVAGDEFDRISDIAAAHK